MKIKPEHYEHLKAEMDKVKAKNSESWTNHKALHTPKRYAWDLLHHAGLIPFVCDTLYPYLNDDHITTAILDIVKTG